MSTKPAMYGLLAEFTEPGDLLAAIHRAREAGYRRMDAYSPFPLEELSEALDFHKTRMPLVVLIGAVTGCISGFLLQYYGMVIGYPYNVGGRPFNSWPAFIPITFEMTILGGALAAVFGMLALNGLPMPYHPLFHLRQFARASQDRYFLCIEATDPKFDRAATRSFLAELGPREVTEVPL